MIFQLQNLLIKSSWRRFLSSSSSMSLSSSWRCWLQATLLLYLPHDDSLPANHLVDANDDGYYPSMTTLAWFRVVSSLVPTNTTVFNELSDPATWWWYEQDSEDRDVEWVGYEREVGNRMDVQRVASSERDFQPMMYSYTWTRARGLNRNEDAKVVTYTVSH